MSQNRFPNLNHLLPPRGQANPPPPPGQHITHITARRTTRQSEAQPNHVTPSSSEQGTMALYPLRHNSFWPAPPSTQAPPITPAQQPSQQYLALDEFGMSGHSRIVHPSTYKLTHFTDQSILSLPDIFVPGVDDVVAQPPQPYNTGSYGNPLLPQAAAPYRNTYASAPYVSDFRRPGPIIEPPIPSRAAAGVAHFDDIRVQPSQGRRDVPNSQAHRALQQAPPSARPG